MGYIVVGQCVFVCVYSESAHVDVHCGVMDYIVRGQTVCVF